MVPPGLGTWIPRRAAAAPQDVAVVHGGIRRTYAELDARIRATAGQLQDLGVGAGDRVAFHGRNEPAALETLLAAAALGAVWVPIHPARPPADVRLIVEDADAQVIVRGRTDAAAPDLPARRIVEADDLGASQGPAPPVATAPPAPDDLVVLGYTSGTSDRPKGVMLSHANLTWNVVHMLATCAMSRADVTIAAAPLTRVGGLAVTVLETLFVGGTVVIPVETDGDSVLQAIQRERVSLLFANPDVLDAMARSSAWAAADLTSVRVGIVGGGLVPDNLLRRYFARGVRLRHGYGLTEASPVVTLLDERDAMAQARSVGRPIGFVELEARDEDGGLCRPDAVGELVVRGPNVTCGYWRRPDATAAASLPGGWFRTGDAGSVDAQGYVTLAGRVRDAIDLEAGRVYPAEIERLLYGVPGVADSAVVAVDGAVVLAVVAQAGAHVSLDDVRSELRPSLPAWKCPSAICLVPAIPRNAAGKVLRHQLTELASRDRPAAMLPRE